MGGDDDEGDAMRVQRVQREWGARREEAKGEGEGEAKLEEGEMGR